MNKSNDPWYGSPVAKVVGFGVLLGIVLLIVFDPTWTGRTNRQVTIGDAELAHILAQWQKTWQRTPTQEEVNQALEGYIREEVLYREALLQGLDENNSLVKRALVTQMNMIAESQADREEITQEDIEAYYTLRSDQFTSDQIYSFSQVYFSADERGESAENDAKESIEDLNRRHSPPGDGIEVGDALMVETHFDKIPEDQISRQLGDSFSKALGNLPTGVWSGPVRSAFGWHVVYVEEVTPGKLIPIESVRGEIIRDLEYDERQAAKEQFFTELMQQYDIVYRGEIKKLLHVE